MRFALPAGANTPRPEASCYSNLVLARRDGVLDSTSAACRRDIVSRGRGFVSRAVRVMPADSLLPGLNTEPNFGLNLDLLAEPARH